MSALRRFASRVAPFAAAIGTVSVWQGYVLPTQAAGTSTTTKECSTFAALLEAEWAVRRSEIAKDASPETLEFYANARRKPFFVAFGKMLPPSRSSLGKYVFARDFTLEEKWRHKIFAYGLLAILKHEFNGNKCGAIGEYPLRKNQCSTMHGKSLYLDSATGPTGKHIDYTGHNIAALAVNEFGEVVTSAFNHNKIFASTAEHAEMRLLEHCFRSPGLHFKRDEISDLEECEVEDKMSKVTVYTSLEPCQQCSGRMLLAGVPAVVYCQRDPDIVLHSLELYRQNFKTRPIPGSLIGFEPYDQLADKYWEHKRKGFSEDIFWIPPSNSNLKGKKLKPSMPYFLCTDSAKDVFDAATTRFNALMHQEHDIEFQALSAEEQKRVLDFRPRANQALIDNLENKLHEKRCQLVEFENSQRKEIQLTGLHKTWQEETLAAKLAEELNDVCMVDGVNVQRFVGRKGESMGIAFVMFESEAGAEKGAAVLEKIAQREVGESSSDPPWKEVVPATFPPKLRRILMEIKTTEKQLSDTKVDNAQSRADDARVLTNKEALQQMHLYVEYERKCERRGTMHR